jgi:hypothetical protein
MMDIQTDVITDESGSPVAVQIPYEDWLRLEGYLAALSSDDAPSSGASSSSPPSPPAEPGAGGASGEPDELHFQKRLLEEWAELDAEETTRTGPSSEDALGAALEAARGVLSDETDPSASLRDLYAEWDRALT